MKRFARALIGAALAIALPAVAFAQSTLLQGSAWTPGHVPIYAGQGSSQPVVTDSGPAGGGGNGLGLSELLQVSRPGNNVNTPPYANSGTGPLNTHNCFYDAPATNPTGYHFLCLDANAQGGGLIAYGVGGSASPGQLQLSINGTVYPFPFTGTGAGNVVGPPSAVADSVSCFDGTTGRLLKVCTVPTVPTPPANDNSTTVVNSAWVRGFAQTVGTSVNPQAGDYTVASTDCGGTVLATGAFKTVTLPAVFGSPCVIRVTNGSSSRAQVLSGFPADLNPGSTNTCGGGKACLWPQQTVEVQIASGAWKTIANPGRWRNSTATLYVDNGGGSDNNDCLAIGSGACLSIQHAIDLACFYIDAVNGSPLINVADSATPYLPFALTTHCLGNNQIQVLGNATTPANVKVNDGGVGQNIIYTKDKGILTVTGMRLFATVAGSTLTACGHLAVIDLNNIEFGNAGATGNITYAVDGCTINWVAGNKIVDTVGGGGSIVDGLLIAERNAIITINHDVTVTGTYTISSYGCLAFASGSIALGSHTFGVMGGFGAKYLAELNGVIYQGAANCPGANPGSTTTGGQAS